MTETPFDVNTEQAVEAEPETGQESAGRRGRPRSQDTLARDEQVLTLLRDRGALTRTEIAEALGVEKQSIAYLSLYRLRRDGKVERVTGNGSRFAWQLTQSA